MTTEESVFSLEAIRLRDGIKTMRAELRTNPTNRVLELDISAREARLAQVDQQHADWVGAENQRAADATKRDADARTELEQRLMDEYRQAAPGTTAAEAQVALPDLLHRFRLGEQDRLAAALVEAKKRIGSF